MVGDIFRNVTDRYMKKIRNTELQNGRLYLLCSDNQPAPLDRSGTSADALYGVHDGLYEGTIFLEVCSRDFLYFDYYVALPEKYRYVREGSADEYRDFFFNFGWDSAMKTATRFKS